MTDRYRFDCPSCEMDIVVDGGVRLDLLENGCPMCGTTVHPENFEETLEEAQ